MSTWADLEALGYLVGSASDKVNVVTGYGIQLYVPVDDQATLDSLCDPTAHADRVDQFENGPPVLEQALTQDAARAALFPLAADATLADVIARLNALGS